MPGLAAFLMIALIVQPQAAPIEVDALTMEPVDPEMGERCQLSAPIPGHPDYERIYLGFSLSQRAPSLWMVGPQLPPPDPEAAPMTMAAVNVQMGLSIGDGSPRMLNGRQVNARTFSDETLREHQNFTLPVDLQNWIDNGSAFTLVPPKGAPIKFAADSVRVHLDAIKDCHRAFIGTLGIDADDYLSREAVALRPPYTLFTSSDYPSRALRSGAEGIARALLSVGADGRVTGCRLLLSSGDPNLDQATCTVFTRRARFEVKGDAEEWLHIAQAVQWSIPQ